MGLKIEREQLTVQSVILMFDTLISMRMVLHPLTPPPLLVSLLIALFKISTPKKRNKSEKHHGKKNSYTRYVHFQTPPVKTNPNLGKLNPQPPRSD